VSVGIDFSGASGCAGMIVKTHGGPGPTAEIGGRKFAFKFLTEGPARAITTEGDALRVGRQVIRLVDGRLVFDTWAEAAK
jgi:hypothetical protein